MGSTVSSQRRTSYSQYTNDFELVVRATKDLEYRLKTEFGAPSGMGIGLEDKIKHVTEHGGLDGNYHLTNQMRRLGYGKNDKIRGNDDRLYPSLHHFECLCWNSEKSLGA
eukprot:CAMPEP_0116842978 /NCGR_PEP_ID=MMETSP0418-20121206/11826_1 /TAXON_ID=1158023 /ORGANISM="Astrosyne radiata, Strain 13vi08-1A" /LENGTH=109 /DNA_ID=CAMNT_0004473667 /DNA_START=70 /DNA_END=399 /DNA_ORIENTATION=+